MGQGIESVDVDKDGNVGITGLYANVIDFGGGSLPAPATSNAFVAKLDASGQFVWNRALSSAENSQGRSIRFDRFGNCFVSGSFSGTVDFGGGPLVSPSTPLPSMFMAKYAPDGSPLWSKRFGEAGGWGEIGHTYVDESGNVYLSGWYTDGVVDFGCGPLAPGGGWDGLAAKLDRAGNCVWSKRFGDGDSQAISSVTVDASGNVIIVGGFAGTADFGGGPLTSSGSDVFVAKFDPAGSHLWSQRFGDAGGQHSGGSVATTKAGDIALVGWFKRTLDFGGNPLTSGEDADGFVAMLDASGNHIWSKRIGGIWDDHFLSAVAIDPWGNVGVGGHFRYSLDDFGGGPFQSAGGFDIVLAKFGATDGKYLWSAHFGDTNLKYGDSSDQYVWDMVYDAAGHTYVTGSFAGNVDFGTGRLYADGVDAYVVKFLP